MFARFRQTSFRLQVSLVETRRADGKVRHEHMASLGSIATPLTVPDRITLWARLHERLARLGNRLGSETQAKVVGALHERIPMVAADEQRALQLANAESDERFWTGMHDLSHATAEDNKGLAASVAGIANAQTAAADAAAKAATARDRAERIKRGENVEGGLGRLMSHEDAVRILRNAGFSNADIAHCQRMAKLGEIVGEDGWKEIRQHLTANADRYEQAAMRRIMRALAT